MEIYFIKVFFLFATSLLIITNIPPFILEKVRTILPGHSNHSIYKLVNLTKVKVATWLAFQKSFCLKCRFYKLTN